MGIVLGIVGGILGFFFVVDGSLYFGVVVSWIDMGGDFDWFGLIIVYELGYYLGLFYMIE